MESPESVHKGRTDPGHCHVSRAVARGSSVPAPIRCRGCDAQSRRHLNKQLSCQRKTDLGDSVANYFGLTGCSRPPETRRQVRLVQSAAIVTKVRGRMVKTISS